MLDSWPILCFRRVQLWSQLTVWLGESTISTMLPSLVMISAAKLHASSAASINKRAIVILPQHNDREVSKCLSVSCLQQNTKQTARCGFGDATVKFLKAAGKANRTYDRSIQPWEYNSHFQYYMKATSVALVRGSAQNLLLALQRSH